MASHRNGTSTRTSAASLVGAIHADRFVRKSFDQLRSRRGRASEAAALSWADGSLVYSAKEPPRILLADTALALHEIHRALLRCIPAVVKSLASCAEMYLHEGQAYALVILLLYPESSETAEAAHFVRNRWRAAKILLLESESAMIDDWLYDDRIDPQLDPARVREAAIRLMSEEKYSIRAQPLRFVREAPPIKLSGTK